MFPWAQGEQSFCPHGVSSLVWRNPNLLAKRDLFSLGCVLLQILGWKRIPTGTLSLCNSSLLVKFKLMVGNHGDDDSFTWLNEKPDFIWGNNYHQREWLPGVLGRGQPWGWGLVQGERMPWQISDVCHKQERGTACWLCFFSSVLVNRRKAPPL